MDSNKPHELTATQAAWRLALKFPDTGVAYWRTFLANNRRRGRTVSRRISFRKVGRAVLYEPAEIDDFARREKARREALQGLAAGMQRRRTGKAGHVQWVVNVSSTGSANTVRVSLSGLTLGFHLTPKQARDLAADLVRLADRFKDERT